MSSHRFSMLASVGLEMACAWRTCCCAVQTAGAARWTLTACRDADEGMREAELLVARITEERSMAGGGVESIAQIEKGKGRSSRRGNKGCQWVVVRVVVAGVEQES